MKTTNWLLGRMINLWPGGLNYESKTIGIIQPGGGTW